jgi:hypothetical protein
MFAKPATRLAPVAGISRGELQVAFFCSWVPVNSRRFLVPLLSNRHIGNEVAAVLIFAPLLPWSGQTERSQANELSLVFNFGRRSDRHCCVEPSPGKLFAHPMDKRLLSGLGQLNSLEAIPQRLQSWAQNVQNI